jgi:hypothetical protein
MKCKAQDLNRLLIVGCVCLVLLFLLLNIYTPLIADDFSDSLGIYSISHILGAMNYTYFYWSGRMVGSFLIFFCLLVGKPFFDIANTIIYCLFIFLVQFHITGKRAKQSPALFIVLNIFFWLFVPVWGHDFLWLTCSCCYLWPTVIALFFLVPFRKKQDDPDYKLNLPFSILFFIVGILAGWSYENLSAAVLFLLIAYFVTKIIRKSKFTLFEILGAIGFLIGFSLLIGAPGNYVRYEVYNKDYDSLLSMLVKRFVSVTTVFNKNHGFLFVFISVFLGFDLVYHHKRKLPVFSYFYFLAALAGTYSMVLSPIFPDRAFLVVVVFLVITLGNVLIQFRMPKIIKRNKALFAAMILIGLCPSFLKASTEIMRLYLRWYDCVELILAEKEKGNLEIEVRPLIGVENKYVGMSKEFDISSKENAYPNNVIAPYFGLKSIKSSGKPVEILWRKRIRQIVIPPWKIIKQARN